MNKIYKKAKDVYIESTVLYPKDKSIYDDVTHDTQTTTDALKEAFLKDSVMDVTKGSYGTDSRTLINPISYSQSKNVGQVGLMFPIIEPGKNKYPIYVEDDIANVTVAAQTDLGTVTKSAEPKFHTGNIGIQNYETATYTYLEFGPDTELCSSLYKLAMDFYKKGKAIPKVTVSMKMGVYRPRDNNIKVRMRSANGTRRNFTIPSSTVRADKVQIFSECTPIASPKSNKVKIEFTELAPSDIFITEVQVEIGNTYTDYEPYRICRTMDPYYAESIVGPV